MAGGGASLIGGTALWVVSTDKIGHINQCLALTDALGVEPDRFERIPGFNLRDGKLTRFRKRLRSLAASLGFAFAAPKGPLVLVISGRSSEYAARLLRWRMGRRLYVISVGAPILFPEVVDLVILSVAILPKWERRKAGLKRAPGLEEMTICGALARRFGEVAPEGTGVAVLVGGENKSFALDDEVFRDGLKAVHDYALSAGVGIEIVLSRRTSARTEAIIREAVAGAPVTIRDREDSGAYRAALAGAGVFLVTPDSVTMLSEVCLTGKPVYAMELTGLATSDGEGERLVESMVGLGVARRFAGSLEAFTPAQHLDEAKRIAPLLAARIADHVKGLG